MSAQPLYPRTYAYSLAVKIGYSAISLAFIAGFAACLFFLETWFPNRLVWSFMAIVFLAMLAVLLYQLLATWRYRLALYDNRLEFRAVFKTHRVLFSDIEKTRNAQRSIGALNIDLVLKWKKTLTIAVPGKPDQAFWDFIDRFPNVEAEATEKEETARYEAIIANPVFGATSEDRLRNYNRQVPWIKGLGWISSGIGLWGFFHPVPYDVCIYVLVAVPALCIAALMVAPGRYALIEFEEKGRFHLGHIASIPISVLFFRAFLDVQLVELKIPLIITVLVALVIVMLMAKLEGRLDIKTAWIPLLMSGLYVWGSLVMLNDVLDTAKPRSEPVEILAKRQSGSDDPDHYLKLKPWRGRDETTEYKVSAKLYERVAVGGKVCMRVYPGKLGWEYFYVRSCEGVAYP